jgi:hypothetical protein
MADEAEQTAVAPTPTVPVTRAGTWAVPCWPGPALSCRSVLRLLGTRGTSCRAGMARQIFLLGLSTARGTAARLRVVPAQAWPSRCDYF